MTNIPILFAKGKLIFGFVHDITTIVDDAAKKITRRFKSFRQDYAKLSSTQLLA